MLYLDASALVKRYIEEEGSELVLSGMEEKARDQGLETLPAVLG